MTFGVTLGQSTKGRIFNKSVRNIVCGVESVVHQDARYHATTFKTSEKSTALYFISLVACNLLHEIKNPHIREMAFDVKSVVHQDARYQKCRSVFTDRYCVWKKSGIVDVKNDVRSYIWSIHERHGIR